MHVILNTRTRQLVDLWTIWKDATYLKFVVHIQVDGLDFLDLGPQADDSVLLLVNVFLQQTERHLCLHLHADL